jgi:tRNA threonylcarbamoyladenosine biosynthesis protein TsaE
MIFKSHSVNDTYGIAKQLLLCADSGTVLALIGDLGTGKTTFTQGFAKALGIKSRVGSPTFKLVSEYNGDFHKLYHIDAYRLNGSNEFLNIGGEEYITSKNSFTLIEWADIIEDILPKKTIKVEFFRSSDNENKREIKITGIKIEI